MADHNTKGRPTTNASATVPAFHDRVRANLRARGLLAGVSAVLASHYSTLAIAFARGHDGKLNRARSVTRARRAAFAWLHLDSGACLSMSEVATLTGCDHSTVSEGVAAEMARRERAA